jgi:putative spermidine/putrescine transport system ATP-binding protein
MVTRLAHEFDDVVGRDGNAGLTPLRERQQSAVVHFASDAFTTTIGGRTVLSAAAPSATGDTLSLDRVSKKFRDAYIVKSVSLRVPSGQILSLLGPSGCGKTTILRMIAGFLRPTSGSISIDGEEANDIPPHRRRLGMVFQNYSLFPHMTVAENVAFGLKMQGVSSGVSRSSVDQSLAMVRMGGLEQRYPAELSGGQQQRVALARAVATRPRLLLLDEPFGALDRKLREELQVEVKQLQRELGITFVFVTHDQEEALTISDRIAVMRDGEIQQFGSPAEIFETPANFFVAEFFGALNTLPVVITGHEGRNTIVSWLDRQFAVPFRAQVDSRIGSNALFAVRASDVRPSLAAPADQGMSITGIVEDTIYKGTSVVYRIRLRDGALFVANADRNALGAVEPGHTVHLSWQREKAFVFPQPNSGEAG